MATLEAIRRRIELAGDLHSVVATMKALSSVEVRDFERSVESLAGSSKVVQYGFRALLHSHPELLAAEPEVTGGHTLAVVFGTDQGLCGPLNRIVVAGALPHIETAGRVTTVAAGARVARQLELAGHPPGESLDLPSSVGGIPAAVRHSLVRIDHLRRHQGVDRVVLFHHRPTGRTGYEPRHTTVVPLDRRLLTAIARRPWPTNQVPLLTMDPQALLECLSREAVKYSLFRAFAEARASEHLARLIAMQGAEQNITDRLTELRRSYHQARQATITAELLDVVSGYQAVGDDAPGSG